jgi:Ca2+-dependent lipid-binding protein
MTSKIESVIFGVAQKFDAHAKKHDSDNSRPATTSDSSNATNDANDAQFDSHERKDGDDDDKEDDGPAGGFDDTPIPQAPPGYTLKFTFHRATNLPMADINSFSSDPYIVAQLYSGLMTRHKEDPPLRLRTPTIRRDTEPVWETEWIVANVPASGFTLKCRIYDEDPADHDDRLGNATIEVGGINEQWPGIQDQAYKIKKRMGSKRAYLMRGLAVALQKTKHMDGSLFVSVENLGKTESDGGVRSYTIGPMWYTKHYSPVLGRIAGRKEPSEGENKCHSKAERYK